MAFEELDEKMASTRLSRTVLVAAGCHLGSGKPNLSVRLMPEIMTRLGWKIGDVVSCAEGTGADGNCVQLKKSETGRGHTISKWAGGTDDGVATFKIQGTRFKHHRMPDSGRTIEAVEYQAFGGALMLMLPDWFEYTGSLV